VADAGEHGRQDDGAAEDVALVDEVGEAVRVRLGLELAARALALLVEEREDPLPQPMQRSSSR
jgi:hypothetical protein